MFSLRFLDEIGKLVSAAKDNINSVTNNCKENLIGHINWIKDVIIGNVDLRANGTNTHITNEANSIRHYIVTGASPTVKSVQRGISHGRGLQGTDYDFDRQYRDIKIASVNLSKATVNIMSGTSFGSLYRLTYGRLIDSTTLRIYQNYFSNSLNEYNGIFNVTWEVKEYF